MTSIDFKTVAKALPLAWKSTVVGRVGAANIKVLRMDEQSYEEETHDYNEALLVAQRGRSLAPIRNSSTARAHWRPSRMAQTTSDWPRRMSPAVKTLSTLVR